MIFSSVSLRYIAFFVRCPPMYIHLQSSQKSMWQVIYLLTLILSSRSSYGSLVSKNTREDTNSKSLKTLHEMHRTHFFV